MLAPPAPAGSAPSSGLHKHTRETEQPHTDTYIGIQQNIRKYFLIIKTDLLEKMLRPDRSDLTVVEESV